MQEKHLFEYAVIRVVPRVEREEFINVGVILYCAKLKFLKCLFNADNQRLQVFAGKFDDDELLKNLQSIEKICCGGIDGGPIGLMDLPSRFRWLTATRSTILQASKVHPGFCIDANQTLIRLYQQMVL